jgi:hypothetical protein
MHINTTRKNTFPHTYIYYAFLLRRAKKLHALLLCCAPISTAHSFGYRTLIFHMHFSLCIAPCQSSTCSIAHNNLRAPLNTLLRDNLYSYYARTTKLLYAMQYLHTSCAHYYVHAHCARLNSGRASAHNILPHGTTIYRATWMPTFSARCQNLPRAPTHQHFPSTLRELKIWPLRNLPFVNIHFN